MLFKNAPGFDGNQWARINRWIKPSKALSDRAKWLASCHGQTGFLRADFQPGRTPKHEHGDHRHKYGESSGVGRPDGASQA